jgi:hypothetical protein
VRKGLHHDAMKQDGVGGHSTGGHSHCGGHQNYEAPPRGITYPATSQAGLVSRTGQLLWTVLAAQQSGGLGSLVQNVLPAQAEPLARQISGRACFLDKMLHKEVAGSRDSPDSSPGSGGRRRAGDGGFARAPFSQVDGAEIHGGDPG